LSGTWRLLGKSTCWSSRCHATAPGRGLRAGLRPLHCLTDALLGFNRSARLQGYDGNGPDCKQGDAFPRFSPPSGLLLPSQAGRARVRIFHTTLCTHNWYGLALSAAQCALWLFLGGTEYLYSLRVRSTGRRVVLNAGRLVGSSWSPATHYRTAFVT
jgi:hypothetical protein